MLGSHRCGHSCINYLLEADGVLSSFILVLLFPVFHHRIRPAILRNGHLNRQGHGSKKGAINLLGFFSPFVIHVFAILVYLISKQLDPSHPSKIVFRQHFFNQVLSLLGHIRLSRKLHLLRIDCGNQARYRFALEGTKSIHHLVQNDAQGPYISLSCIGLSFEDFWSHINRRSKHCLREVLVWFKSLAKPEIS